jgi:hypothetical protein
MMIAGVVIVDVSLWERICPVAAVDAAPGILRDIDLSARRSSAPNAQSVRQRFDALHRALQIGIRGDPRLTISGTS